MKRVLFACVHNAGRSQMAAALFNLRADPQKARAISAGTNPGAAIHPEIRVALLELGLELAGAVPKLLTPALARGCSHLITMGCGDQCPVVPGAVREDWPLRDPKGQPLEIVREIREEVLARVEALIAREGWGGGAST